MQISDEMVEVAAKAYADATGYYVEFHRGLSSPSADKIRAAMREALSAALGAMAVKRLEWHRGDGIKEDADSWHAETIVGRYFVIEGEWSLERGLEYGGECSDNEAAKAAAQADYNRRILSALSLGEVKSEPVAWRYRYKDASLSAGSNRWVLANQNPATSRTKLWREIRDIEPLFAHPPRLQEQSE